jgi:hypothetical protein
MRFFMQRRSLLWCAVFLLLHRPLDSAASSFEVNPSLALSASYNDNIFYEEKDPRCDYVTVFTPAVRGLYRSETTKASVAAHLNIHRHVKTDGLDNTDQVYHALLDRKLTPRWKMAVQGGYLVDSRRDRDLEESGLIVDAGDRRRLNGGLNLVYRVTERMTLHSSLGAEQEDYADPEKHDYESRNVSLSLNRSFSMRSTGMLQVGAGRYVYTRQWTDKSPHPWGALVNQYDEARDIDSYSMSVGWRHTSSETWRLEIRAGGRYSLSEQKQSRRRTVQTGSTEIEISSTRETARSDSRSALGNLSLSYAGEQSRLHLEVGYDFKPASGRDGATNRTQASLHLDRRYGGDWRAGLVLRYNLNQSDSALHTGQEQKTDQETIQLQPYLRYRFNETLYLEMRYRKSWLHDRALALERRQNVISLSLRWDVPDF